MPRIRTIQPHFPRSGSMSRVGRETRLLFVLLWTVADDAGRARAASAGLAALLYASDPDAPMCLPAWLDELEREGCIERYTVDGVEYLRVVHWHKYQTIDHPTPSRLPPSPQERSRHSRKAREASRNVREKVPKSPAELDFDGLPPEIREIFMETSPPAERPKITEERVEGHLERLLAAAEARGVFTAAVRSAELMGRRIGMWAGRKPSPKDGERRDTGSTSPRLADVVSRTSMQPFHGAPPELPRSDVPGKGG